LYTKLILTKFSFEDAGYYLFEVRENGTKRRGVTCKIPQVMHEVPTVYYTYNSIN
jgi:hypothetical protein